MYGTDPVVKRGQPTPVVLALFYVDLVPQKEDFVVLILSFRFAKICMNVLHHI
jgi:hypothetical protein